MSEANRYVIMPKKDSEVTRLRTRRYSPKTKIPELRFEQSCRLCRLVNNCEKDRYKNESGAFCETFSPNNEELVLRLNSSLEVISWYKRKITEMEEDFYFSPS